VVLVRASGRLAPDAIHQAAAVVALRVRGTGASTATALQFQVSAPVADLADGSWTTQLGSAVDLYASIDEQIPDGADYIQSSLSPLVVDQCRVLLAPLDDPGTTGNHTLRVMFKKDDLAGDRIDLTVTLYAHDGTTAIAVGAEPNIQDVVTVEVSILPTQAALLTPADYEQGLILEFSAVKV
jgi:hypothetical protein